MRTADLVATARARSGLTQRQLAERSGTSAAAICHYEAGRRTPRVDTLIRIIAATGAALELDLVWPDAIDVERNGRVLAEVLDLADHLPQHHEPTLQYPVLALAAG